MAFAARERARCPDGRALDIGCGAGRNLVPLALQGWPVDGTDFSRPMVEAAREKAAAAGVEARVRLALAPMDHLPVDDRTFDLIVAHGIWNLARTSAEFRRGVAEAARVARPGAGLFVFTFSRNTFPEDTRPVAGEPFVFTQLSGQPQCFLTKAQLLEELAGHGFHVDPAEPLTEHNRPRQGTIPTSRVPVIYEAVFRFGPPANRP